MKRLTPVAAAVFALATSLGTTATFGKDYVIVSKSQGAGSVNLDQAVVNAKGTLTGRQQEIGVAFASSDDPGFAGALLANSAVQSVTEDVMVRWIPDMKIQMADADTVRRDQEQAVARCLPLGDMPADWTQQPLTPG